MKKSVLISLIALGVSLVGLVIALAAWMRKKKELCCDDFDDDLLMDDDDSEYIAAQYGDTQMNRSPTRTPRPMRMTLNKTICKLPPFIISKEEAVFC